MRICLMDVLNEGRAPLAVSEYKDIMKHQGQYPVVFFTLKFIESTTWKECFNELKRVIARIYRYHIYFYCKVPFLTKHRKRNLKILSH